MTKGQRIYFTARAAWVIVMTMITLPILLDMESVQSAQWWEPVWYAPLILTITGIALGARDAFRAAVSARPAPEPAELDRS